MTDIEFFITVLSVGHVGMFFVMLYFKARLDALEGEDDD